MGLTMARDSGDLAVHLSGRDGQRPTSCDWDELHNELFDPACRSPSSLAHAYRPNLPTTTWAVPYFLFNAANFAAPDEALACWVARWHVGTEGSVSAPTPPYIETRHAVTSLHFREAGSPHIADHRHTSLHSNSHPVLAATVFSSDSSLKTAGFKSDPRKLPLGSSHRQRQPTW